MSKVLFFGELPGAIVHGVSASNKLILDLLGINNDVLIVEEKNRFSKSRFVYVLLKSIDLLVLPLRLCTCLYSTPTHVYTNLPTSFLGLIKTSLFLFFCKAFISKDASYIVHIHRGDFQHFCLSSKTNMKLVRCCLSMVTRVVVLSPSQISFIEEVFGVKTFYLYNSLPWDVDDTLIAKPVDVEVLNLTFLSNIIVEKGIFDLIEVVKKIPENYNFVLSIYGSFQHDSVKKHFFDSIEGYDNILYHGTIVGEKKKQVLSLCDVFILPSYNEGQPIAIIEAMSFGKPILATNVGVVAEMFWPNYPLIINAGDKHQLRLKILACFDLELRKKVSTQLIDNFKFKFNRSRYLDKLNIIFE